MDNKSHNYFFVQLAVVGGSLLGTFFSEKVSFNIQPQLLGALDHNLHFVGHS